MEFEVSLCCRLSCVWFPPGGIRIRGPEVLERAVLELLEPTGKKANQPLRRPMSAPCRGPQDKLRKGREAVQQLPRGAFCESAEEVAKTFRHEVA